jgi:hypothetical protein
MQCNWNSHIFLVGMQNATETLEDNLAVLVKLNLSHSPAISFIDIGEMKTHIGTNNFMLIFATY